MTSEPTVFVVDDDSSVRESITWMLSKVGLKVESFDSPRAILEVYDATRPGCLVLDLRLPGMNGLELHRRLSEKGCHNPFVMVTGHGEVSDAVEALHQGAIDFIEKPYSRLQLLNRVQQALKRDAAERKIASIKAELLASLAELTARELQVLRLVVDGKVTKVIARQLNLSPKTVEVHRSNIVRKFKVESIAALVVRLVRLQIELPRVNTPGRRR